MTAPRHKGFATVLNPNAYAVDWLGFYERALHDSVAVRNELTYGVGRYASDDEHQVVNIFRPAEAVGAPVLVFFHGGRWREGHPDYYDALARPWVEAGVVFVSAGYRLEPLFTKRNAVEDAAAAVRWVAAHAEQWGGNPQRLSLAGHSAGGHLAAVLAATPYGQGLLGSGVAESLTALIGVSGVYDIRADEPGVEGEELSPALRACSTAPVTVLSYGTPEPNATAAPRSFFADQGDTFVRALRERKVPVTQVPLPDHDHIRTAQAFGTAGTALFDEALAAVMAATHQEVSR